MTDDPTRIKGIERVNRIVRKLGKKATNPKTGNNCTLTSPVNLLFTVIVAARINNLTFADMQITDIKDASRRHKNYYNVLACLYLIGKPATQGQVLNTMGLQRNSAKPVLDNLLNAGYIRQKQATKQSNFYKGFSTMFFDGYELTSKGLDKLTFINSLLVENSLF